MAQIGGNEQLNNVALFSQSQQNDAHQAIEQLIVPQANSYSRSNQTQSLFNQFLIVVICSIPDHELETIISTSASIINTRDAQKQQLSLMFIARME